MVSWSHETEDRSGGVASFLTTLHSLHGGAALNNDNDNDKRLGLTAKADQPDHKIYNTPKIKMDNEALQRLNKLNQNVE